MSAMKITNKRKSARSQLDDAMILAHVANPDRSNIRKGFPCSHGKLLRSCPFGHHSACCGAYNFPSPHSCPFWHFNDHSVRERRRNFCQLIHRATEMIRDLIFRFFRFHKKSKEQESNVFRNRKPFQPTIAPVWGANPPGPRVGNLVPRCAFSVDNEEVQHVLKSGHPEGHGSCGLGRQARWYRRSPGDC